MNDINELPEINFDDIFSPVEEVKTITIKPRKKKTSKHVKPNMWKNLSVSVATALYTQKIIPVSYRCPWNITSEHCNNPIWNNSCDIAKKTMDIKVEKSVPIDITSFNAICYKRILELGKIEDPPTFIFLLVRVFAEHAHPSCPSVAALQKCMKMDTKLISLIGIMAYNVLVNHKGVKFTVWNNVVYFLYKHFLGHDNVEPQFMERFYPSELKDQVISAWLGILEHHKKEITTKWTQQVYELLLKMSPVLKVENPLSIDESFIIPSSMGKKVKRKIEMDTTLVPIKKKKKDQSPDIFLNHSVLLPPTVPEYQTGCSIEQTASRWVASKGTCDRLKGDKKNTLSEMFTTLCSKGTCDRLNGEIDVNVFYDFIDGMTWSFEQPFLSRNSFVSQPLLIPVMLDIIEKLLQEKKEPISIHMVMFLFYSAFDIAIKFDQKQWDQVVKLLEMIMDIKSNHSEELNLMQYGFFARLMTVFIQRTPSKEVQERFFTLLRFAMGIAMMRFLLSSKYKNLDKKHAVAYQLLSTKHWTMGMCDLLTIIGCRKRISEGLTMEQKQYMCFRNDLIRCISDLLFGEEGVLLLHQFMSCIQTDTLKDQNMVLFLKTVSGMLLKIPRSSFKRKHLSLMMIDVEISRSSACYRFKYEDIPGYVDVSIADVSKEVLQTLSNRRFTLAFSRYVLHTLIGNLK